MDGSVDELGIVERWGIMKSFYAPAAQPAPVAISPGLPVAVLAPPTVSYIRTRARIALYDAPAVAPRVEEIDPAPIAEYIEALSSRVYELARFAGGSIPYTVIREVAENFIHADFAEPVVSIMDSGSTVRFADQGPGIPDKERAVQPGFTTASGDAKRFIRGVGSGLPIVRDYLSCSGGSLVIEDNLGTGSVVTVRSNAGSVAAAPASGDRLRTSADDQFDVMSGEAEPELGTAGPRPALPRLSTRQKHVLALVLESGSVGPSLVAKELGVGVSTAYRDLASLEELGLMVAQGGKRNLTDLGFTYLDGLATR